MQGLQADRRSGRAIWPGYLRFASFSSWAKDRYFAGRNCHRLSFEGDETMTQWKGEQLDKLGKAEEVQIASIGRDGTMRKPVTVWVVRHSDDLYVRSVGGRNGHWFRSVRETHEGRIRAGGVQQDVTFVELGDDVNDD